MPKDASKPIIQPAKTITVDETETPIDPDSYFDIYIRFNDDLEKDYCFQVNDETKFADLFHIFRSLPLSLRPSVFYHGQPTNFRISTSPGYLTSDGALLFDYNAEKLSRAIPSVNEKIVDHVHPGQLILPQWEFNSFAYYAFVSALLVWLYTDLPDFISPTPGLCLTNFVTKIATNVLEKVGQHALAKRMVDDINEPVSHLLQGTFFVMHFFKCLIIYFVLYSGMFNPIKIIRFGNKGVKLDVSHQELIEMGWTGSRRATPDDYVEHYRNYKIEQHGGLVPAHQAGVFDSLKNLGSVLKAGEGFDTPLGTKASLEEIEKSGKFLLTDAYSKELRREFTDFLATKPELEMVTYIKQYRRYGLLYSDEKIKKIVDMIKERKSQTQRPS